MWFRGIAVFFIASLATAQTPPGVARRALDLLLAEKYADLFQTFAPEMQAAITVQVMQEKIGPQIKTFGHLENIGDPKISKTGNLDVYAFPVNFASATIELEFAFNRAQQTAGIHFRPVADGWQPPAYNQPALYREREVTIGGDAWKLPGTLSMPAGKGPFAGVVLVHGSGPNDRDETVSAIKVFKDLAQGLASRGIAVLRYEKRTRIYSAQMAALTDFTVAQETVDDAVRAAALLRTQPEIDGAKVFVIGHSLGGYVGPRIAKQDGKLAGLIVMAGPVQPLEDIILEQNIAELPGTPTLDQQRQLEPVRLEVEAVKQLSTSKKNPAMLFGVPASYFLDLQGYNPAALAKTLDLPLLILYGERDFQVTMKDFDLWKAGLANRKSATLRSYPGLSHLFVTGEGKGSLAEYAKPGHVSAEVIGDIAQWIAAPGGSVGVGAR